MLRWERGDVLRLPFSLRAATSGRTSPRRARWTCCERRARRRRAWRSRGPLRWPWRDPPGSSWVARAERGARGRRWSGGPSTGRPRSGPSPRTACSTGGGDVCRALACDGSDRLKCAAFKSGLDVECTPASCTAGVETPAAFCDGAGSCKAGTTRPCAPFVCGDKACKKSCTSNADCTKGNVCDTTTSQCVPSKASCSTDGTTSKPGDGTGSEKPCSPYLCNPSTGDCYGDCNTAAQCAPGFACDGNRCVPGATPAADDGGGCGCTTAGREAPVAPYAGVLGMVVAGWAAKRRRNRR